jgi:hypothetical protein
MFQMSIQSCEMRQARAIGSALGEKAQDPISPPASLIRLLQMKNPSWHEWSLTASLN